MDFYREQVNPLNSNQVWFRDHWEDLNIIEEKISVKDKDDVILKVRISRHGPIINDVLDSVGKKVFRPVAISWKMLENY